MPLNPEKLFELANLTIETVCRPAGCAFAEQLINRHGVILDVWCCRFDLYQPIRLFPNGCHEAAVFVEIGDNKSLVVYGTITTEGFEPKKNA